MQMRPPPLFVVRKPCVCVCLLLLPAQAAIVAWAITLSISLAEFQGLPTEAVLLRANDAAYPHNRFANTAVLMAYCGVVSDRCGVIRCVAWSLHGPRCSDAMRYMVTRCAELLFGDFWLFVPFLQ